MANLRTVGATGRNHATLADYQTYLTTQSPLADDQIAEFYNDATFNITSQVSLGTSVTMNGHTITLRPAAGHGFKDNVDAAVFDFKPLQTNGVLLNINMGYSSFGITLEKSDITIEGMQIQAVSGSVASLVRFNAQNQYIKESICDIAVNPGGSPNPRCLWGWQGINAQNVHVIMRDPGGNRIGISSYNKAGAIDGCTVVRPTGLTVGTGRGLYTPNSSGGTLVAVNCAEFGFGVDSALSTGSDYNATDRSPTWPGTHNLTGLTYADQFTNVTSGAYDYSIKAGSDLIGAGVDTSVSIDVLGSARTSPPIIGAKNFVDPSVPRVSISNSNSNTIIGSTEADIRTGGKVIQINLSADTWVASGTTFDAQRQNIIDGLDAASSLSNGWDAIVKAGLAVTDVVRVSDTRVEVTLPAFSEFYIGASESVTFTVPSTAVMSGTSYAVTAPFVIAALTHSCAISGGPYTAAQIVAGGQTFTLTLTNDQWPDSGDFDNTVKQTILDGVMGLSGARKAWEYSARAQVTASTAVVRTSVTVVTVTLPAISDYANPKLDQLSFIADASVVKGNVEIRATGTVNITTSGVPNDALKQLIDTLDKYEVVKINANTLTPAVRQALLANTQANFDRKFIDTAGASEGWASDASVPGTQNGDLHAFSGPGVDPEALYVVYRGGGHSASVDSSIYKLDILAACTSLLAAGPGASWGMAVKSATYWLDGTVPAWSHQTPTNQFIADENVDSIRMPPAVHTYAGTVWVGRGVMNLGGKYGYGNLGSDNNNDWFDFNVYTDVVTHRGQINGYHQVGGQNLGAAVLNPVQFDGDGNVYSFGNNLAGQDVGAFRLYRWRNASFDPALITGLFSSAGSFFEGENETILIRDPVDPAKRQLWSFKQATPTGTDQFETVGDVAGASGGPFATGNFAGNTTAPFAITSGFAFDWDNEAGRTHASILGTIGDNTLYFIDPEDSYSIDSSITLTGATVSLSISGQAHQRVEILMGYGAILITGGSNANSTLGNTYIARISDVPAGGGAGLVLPETMGAGFEHLTGGMVN